MNKPTSNDGLSSTLSYGDTELNFVDSEQKSKRSNRRKRKLEIFFQSRGRELLIAVMAEDSNAHKEYVPPPVYDLNAKWDACLDLTLRRGVYYSFIGAFGGLLFFSEFSSTRPPFRPHFFLFQNF